MSLEVDLKELNESIIGKNLATTRFYNLDSLYSPYSIYVENRENDIPVDNKLNLWKLLDDGINNLSEDDYEIVVSEKISSYTEILCTTNYEKIITEFGHVDDVIEYNDIVTQLSDIEDLDPSAQVTELSDWINTYIDLSINPNPENADDSNLILTKEISGDIQRITETILNKIFRNLVQIVRVKRDYRMYGPGATIMGKCYADAKEISAHTAIPPSCWTPFIGNYLVGKSAYKDALANVGNTIANAKYNISPFASYTTSPHSHSISIDITDLPNKIGAKHDLIGSIESENVKGVACTNEAGGKDWKDTSIGGFNGHTLGCALIGDEQGTVSGNASWSYKWSSSNCSLNANTTMKTNPYSTYNVRLPTYSLNVWKWTSNDTETNITTPMKFIS